jgi:hypothetical protein
VKGLGRGHVKRIKDEVRKEKDIRTEDSVLSTRVGLNKPDGIYAKGGK